MSNYRCVDIVELSTCRECRIVDVSRMLNCQHVENVKLSMCRDVELSTCSECRIVNMSRTGLAMSRVN